MAASIPIFSARHKSESSAKAETAEYQEKLRALQYLMYAEDKRSLLICLQAMDAGGKDGTIQHVMGAMNPQNCRVQAFKAPSAEEAPTTSYGGYIRLSGAEEL